MSATVIDDDVEGPVALGSGCKSDDEIDMTPMIDVTFLLLIFFVVTSDMNPENAAELPAAQNGGVIALNTAALVQVLPGTGDQPDVLVGDNFRKLPNDPDSQEVELSDFLRSELDRGKNMIVIQAAGDATTGQVAAIRKVISQAVGDDIEKLHIAVMESK